MCLLYRQNASGSLLSYSVFPIHLRKYKRFIGNNARTCVHTQLSSEPKLIYLFFLKTDSSLMSLHELVFTANVYVSACEGENWGLKNTHCYARLNVVSSVTMVVRRRLHGKLLLPNSNTSTHTHAHASLTQAEKIFTARVWMETYTDEAMSLHTLLLPYQPRH